MTYDSQAITSLLAAWRDGDTASRDELVTLIYRELRGLAAVYLRKERLDHTLQPTALVHETYLRLVASEPISWQNRTHFFAIAAQQMRRLLIEYARNRLAEKRGGGRVKVSLTAIPEWNGRPEEDVLAVHEALTKLADLDPRAAQVVEIRFFGGLEESEAAEALGLSIATVKRDWKFARAWLFDQLTRPPCAPE